MTRVRGLEGLPVGRMVADTSGIQRYAPPAATCERCGCKLSRYRDAWESACAACQRVLVAEGRLVVPIFDPAATSSAELARLAATQNRPLAEHEKAAMPGYVLCECGRGHRKKRSKRCGPCHQEARAAGTLITRRKRSRDEQLATGNYCECECGRGLRRKQAPRCRKCTNEARRQPGARWAVTCRCGGVKAKGSVMCYTCRYGRVAA